MLRQNAPDFELPSTNGKVKLADILGKWLVLFFYAKNFTSVCSSELIEFNRHYEKFRKMNAAVVGISTDDIESHKKCAEELKLKFPLASDFAKEVSKKYGVLSEKGLAFRGTFIIDPEGLIKFVTIADLGTGRSIKEILRVLKALQTGEMTQAEWRGGETLGKA